MGEAAGAQRSRVGRGKLCRVDVGCREIPMSREKLAITYRGYEIIFLTLF